MKNVYLRISKNTYSKILNHLISNDNVEDAAFIYAKEHVQGDSHIFELVDWELASGSDYESRSEVHLHIGDKMRAHIIKKAHDLQASLIELHSHSGHLSVQFSPSDYWGFKDFVPHVWWRLQGKPYLAFVFNKTGFDALIWYNNPHTPEQVDGIIIDNQCILPTKLTLFNEFQL